MPTLYIRPDNHTKNTAVPNKINMERATSQKGGPKASLAGITIGENKGNKEEPTANVESGDSKAAIIIYNAKITGMVIGKVKD